MLVTCPACGRKAAVSEQAREVLCDCGRRFDPTARATVADPFLGKELGGYRIEEVLGSGGMGTVYKATQLSLDRPVAFKVLPPNVADDPQFVHRFHREAEVLASLGHPHIVQVIDRGEAEGRFFIVMEYVAGQSLRELIRTGPVPPREACRVVSGLLDALDYAHARGVVHRDIKPENILVSKDGVVKVADFGLSRVLGSTELGTRLTRTHLVLGTYEYMAPEQRESVKEADARSDIYASAVVLYEMLTGELPIGRFKLPSRKIPGVDRRLDRILERGLAKDPADRYERASSMVEEIGSLLTTPGAPVDLAAFGNTARRFTERVQQVMRRDTIDPEPRPPTSFDLRLDLLLTLLAVCGILVALTGVGFLLAGDDFELGLATLDESYAGVLLIVYGVLLWNAAERARRYWPGARTMLLTLTALAALTLVALPFTVWAWVVLVSPSMRAYYDARHRGLGAAEAAALAQGLPLLPHARPEVVRRRRTSARANRRVAVVCGCVALAALLGWAIVASGGKVLEDEGAFFLALTGIASGIAIAFAALAQQVRQGQWLHLNSWIWTVLGVLAPRTGRRARMLARDARDGLA
ncbi:MAG: serine/threonine-protein kinase [Planctomycetota bacterium]|jgi:predicted Ser/Thr protein kinase